MHKSDPVGTPIVFLQRRNIFGVKLVEQHMWYAITCGRENIRLLYIEKRIDID